MPTHDEAVEIPVGSRRIPGTLIAPATATPGMLFVQGWGSGQEEYLPRAREIAALGCLCLTFEPRGVARDHDEHETITREDNLRDLLAAYDLLASQRAVDASALGMVGASYGGYLAAVLSAQRPLRWLALRAPALHKDEHWSSPKRRLDRDELAAYRRRPLDSDENRALRACAAFEGDVLVVGVGARSGRATPCDANYLSAFAKAHSLTYRVIQGADHALSEEPWQEAYTALLVNWATEMVLGARGHGSAPKVQGRQAATSRKALPVP